MCTFVTFCELRNSRFGTDPDQPLFIFSDESVLSKIVLNKHIKLCVALIGINPDNNSGHSLRSDGATDVAMPALLIRKLNS